MAGNQLKKFLPVQRYFSPWKWKYNLHTTEFVFPITVKVTEPLRFFFCRFLLESAAGLFLVCVAAPRLSIWIFTFQKFRLEVLAVKYAPRKVYIKESGGYVELSYTDFCRRRQADKGYMDKLFIPVQGCLLEVVREQYADFYRDRERWRYLLQIPLKYKRNSNIIDQHSNKIHINSFKTELSFDIFAYFSNNSDRFSNINKLVNGRK